MEAQPTYEVGLRYAVERRAFERSKGGIWSWLKYARRVEGGTARPRYEPLGKTMRRMEDRSYKVTLGCAMTHRGRQTSPSLSLCTGTEN